MINTTNLVRAVRALSVAENVVRPYVGELAIACDSAEGVYRAALTHLGVDVSRVHSSGLEAIFNEWRRGTVRGRPPLVAADSAGADDYAKMFPDAARIGHY